MIIKFTYVCIDIHIYNIQTCKIAMVCESVQAIQSHTDGINLSSKDSKSKPRNVNLISNICVLKNKRADALQNYICNSGFPAARWKKDRRVARKLVGLVAWGLMVSYASESHPASTR